MKRSIASHHPHITDHLRKRATSDKPFWSYNCHFVMMHAELICFFMGYKVVRDLAMQSRDDVSQLRKVKVCKIWF